MACKKCGFQRNKIYGRTSPKVVNEKASTGLSVNSSKAVKTTSKKNNKDKSNLDKEVNGDEIVICPRCDCQVKKKNLKKHTQRIHKTKRRAGRKKGGRYIPPPRENLTAAEALELRKAIEDQNLCSDREIAEYLKKNPLKDEMGKFGVPQDKYRWGFYGSKSMEYDAWGKGDKDK